MFWKKKKRISRKMLDTSQEGYQYIGINFTNEQYEDMCMINLMSMSEECKDIPVHSIILVLKCLGLLPPELMRKVSNDQSADNTQGIGNNELQKRYGRFKD